MSDEWLVTRDERARGVVHEFHLYRGGHDWEYFAEHLSAPFEFRSHALGLATAAK